MIEFNGSYFQYSSSDALSVLVQFDGSELLVWHVPEPFFRLAAFDSFRVTVRKDTRSRSISLPNGARIETNDLVADTLISSRCKQGRCHGIFTSRVFTLPVLLALLALLVCGWALYTDYNVSGLLK